MRIYNSRSLLLISLAIVILVFINVLLNPALTSNGQAAPEALPSIVFVARSHLATPDRIFQSELGPAGQFGTGLPKYAPGSKLVRLDPGGSLFVYDTPGLVDVQSPDVSFDGSKIVFSGATTLIPGTNDSGWRLYEINVDGTGFHQLTLSDRAITIPNASQFLNQETYGDYDDLFPAYLADGRIIFTSSRYPSRAHYDDRRTYNLYVINADGSGLHRITTERGGLLHPTPLPDGRILTTRWWNQFNQPSELGIFNRIDNADETYLLADGTIIHGNPDAQFNPPTGILPGGFPIRGAPNTWHLMVLNPDGSEFKRLAWTPVYIWALDDDSGRSDTYAASQPAVVINNNQEYIAFTSQTDSSMVHSTLKTGIRVALPEVEMMYANTTDAIAGLSYEKAWGQGDESGPYALHPWGMTDGTILFSESIEDNSLPSSGTYTEGSYIFDLQGSNLKYRLFTMNIDGSAKTPVPIDLGSINMATADVMDGKPISVRTGWTALPDAFTDVASDDPVMGNLPNTMPEYWFSQHGPGQIETATIHNPNVYANPGLDLPFVNNSPPPGSVVTAQVWVDANQFTGAKCYNGWPQPCDTFKQDNKVRGVLWDEVPVTLSGAFTMTIPADTMGFVVLRDAQGRVVRSWNRGYISIAQGSAWARPDEEVTCVGCHMGHVSGTLDAIQTEAEAGWLNIAPYANISASSYYAYFDPNSPTYLPFRPHFVNDRRGWVPIPPGGPPTPEGVEGILESLPALLSSRIETIPELANGHPLNIGGDPGYQDDETGWISELGLSAGEWIELDWPSGMLVKEIRIVGPPPKGGDWGGFGEPEANGDYYIESGMLEFEYQGAAVGAPVPVGRVEPLENGATLITLPSPMIVDRIKFTALATSGSWWWDEVAALNEIEVIGQAAEPWPLLEISNLFLPVAVK